MIQPGLSEGAKLVLEPTRQHVDRSSAARINIDGREHLRDHCGMPKAGMDRADELELMFLRMGPPSISASRSNMTVDTRLQAGRQWTTAEIAVFLIADANDLVRNRDLGLRRKRRYKTRGHGNAQRNMGEFHSVTLLIWQIGNDLALAELI